MLSQVPVQWNEQVGCPSKIYKIIWHTSIHPSWKVFILKLVQNRLPTRVNLLTRGIDLDPNCYHYSDTLEDQNHIFKQRTYATMFWSQNVVLLPQTQYDLSSQTEWIITHIMLFRSKDGLHSERLIKFIISLWSLWVHRNNNIFKDGYFSQQRFSHYFSLVICNDRPNNIFWVLASSTLWREYEYLAWLLCGKSR